MRTIVSSIFLTIAPFAYCMDHDSISPGKNMVYIEMGGTNIFYSANYEHAFMFGSRLGIATGLSITPNYLPLFNLAFFQPALGIPLKIVFRVKTHEFGLGASLSGWYEGLSSAKGPFIMMMGQLCYSKFYGRMYFGGSFTPQIMNEYYEPVFGPWGSLRLGFHF